MIILNNGYRVGFEPWLPFLDIVPLYDNDLPRNINSNNQVIHLPTLLLITTQQLIAHISLSKDHSISHIQNTISYLKNHEKLPQNAHRIAKSHTSLASHSVKILLTVKVRKSDNSAIPDKHRCWFSSICTYVSVFSTTNEVKEAWPQFY